MYHIELKPSDIFLKYWRKITDPLMLNYVIFPHKYYKEKQFTLEDIAHIRNDMEILENCIMKNTKHIDTTKPYDTTFVCNGFKTQTDEFFGLYLSNLGLYSQAYFSYHPMKYTATFSYNGRNIDNISCMNDIIPKNSYIKIPTEKFNISLTFLLRISNTIVEPKDTYNIEIYDKPFDYFNLQVKKYYYLDGEW